MSSNLKIVANNLSRRLLLSDLKEIAKRFQIPHRERKDKLALAIADFLLSDPLKRRRGDEDREYRFEDPFYKLSEEKIEELFLNLDRILKERDLMDEDIERLKKEFATSKSQYDDSLQKFKKKMISRSELDLAENRLEEAQKNLDLLKERFDRNALEKVNLLTEIQFKNLADRYMRSRNLETPPKRSIPQTTRKIKLVTE